MNCCHLVTQSTLAHLLTVLTTLTMLSHSLLLSLLLASAQPLPAQKRLYKDLLADYNPLFIPISNITADQVQRVQIEANLQKIIDVDTEKVSRVMCCQPSTDLCLRVSSPASSGSTSAGRMTTSSGTLRSTAASTGWSCPPARSGLPTSSFSTTLPVTLLTTW